MFLKKYAKKCKNKEEKDAKNTLANLTKQILNKF